MWTDKKVQDKLKATIEAIAFDFDQPDSDLQWMDDLEHPAWTSGVQQISTFEDEMILTTDKGVVIHMEDGSEFQITIVQSKRARD
jgi:hypothetical protein